MMEKRNLFGIKVDNDLCHGCCGKGWIDIKGDARICPVCLGTGKKRITRKVPEPYPEENTIWTSDGESDITARYYRML